MKNNLKSELQSLERWELNILARKLGIEKKPKNNIYIFRTLHNLFYHFLPQKKKLVEKIIYDSNYKKTVKEFLRINSKLKSLDEDRLKGLTCKMRIEEIAYNKKSDLVKNVISNAELEDIDRKLNINRVLINRLLAATGAVVVVLLILYIKEYSANLSLKDLVSYENLIAFLSKWPELWKTLKDPVFLKKTLIDKLILGWLGSLASIIGFFLIFSPETELNWKRRIITCWTTNRLEFIWFLILLMSYFHPNSLVLFGSIAAPASIASILITFIDKQTLDYWRKQHFYKIYYAIICILVLGLLYIINYIPQFKISGNVYKEGVPVSGKIALFERQNFATEINKSEFHNLPLPENYMEKFKEEFKIKLMISIEKENKGDDIYYRDIYPSEIKENRIFINIKNMKGTWDCHFEDCKEDCNFTLKISQDNDKEVAIKRMDEIPIGNCSFNGEKFSYNYKEGIIHGNCDKDKVGIGMDNTGNSIKMGKVGEESFDCTRVPLPIK